MLQNEYVLATIGFDTIENGPIKKKTNLGLSKESHGSSEISHVVETLSH